MLQFSSTYKIATVYGKGYACIGMQALKYNITQLKQKITRQSELFV